MRRAVVDATVARLIIALVIVALIGAITTAYILSINSVSDKAACRVSVELQLFTKQFTSVGDTIPGGVNSPTDLSCARRFIRVVEDSASMVLVDLKRASGKETPYVYARPQMTEGSVTVPQTSRIDTDPEGFSEDIQQMAAYEMAECWDAFLRGEQRVLNQNSVYQNVNSCVICSEIHLDREMEPVTLGLRDHLKATPHHFYGGSDATNYDEFLYHNNPPGNSEGCLTHFGETEEVTFEGGKSYAVLFLRRGSRVSDLRQGMAQQGYAHAPWSKAFRGALAGAGAGAVGGSVFFGIGALPGAALGAVVGGSAGYDLGAAPQADSQCQTVWIVPIEETPRYCDVVVN